MLIDRCEQNAYGGHQFSYALESAFYSLVVKIIYPCGLLMTSAVYGRSLTPLQ